MSVMCRSVCVGGERERDDQSASLKLILYMWYRVAILKSLYAYLPRTHAQG